MGRPKKPAKSAAASKAAEAIQARATPPAAPFGGDKAAAPTLVQFAAQKHGPITIGASIQTTTEAGEAQTETQNFVFELAVSGYLEVYVPQKWLPYFVKNAEGKRPSFYVGEAAAARFNSDLFKKSTPAELEMRLQLMTRANPLHAFAAIQQAEERGLVGSGIIGVVAAAKAAARELIGVADGE